MHVLHTSKDQILIYGVNPIHHQLHVMTDTYHVDASVVLFAPVPEYYTLGSRINKSQGSVETCYPSQYHKINTRFPSNWSL